jgi:type VI secretion system protein ImpB
MLQDDGKTAPSRVNIVYSSNEGEKSDVELPFKVLVMGDFAGAEDPTPLIDREAVPVNSDNLDAVMRAISPRVEISVRDALRGGKDYRIPVMLSFTSFDDFSPKRLVESIGPLQEALALRRGIVEARKALSERPALAAELKDLLAKEGYRERLLEGFRKRRAGQGGSSSGS